MSLPESQKTRVPSVSAVVSRVASVDALRGLTILLMVFVNDIGPAAPSWMHHIQPPDADGMTLADLVFPLFLFIAGVSIPLAFQTARKRGQTGWQILGHILSRSIALLAMGLIEVNRYAETTLGPDLWGLLAFLSIILAWCVVPREDSIRRRVLLALKIIGIIGVIVLFAIYRREPFQTEVLFLGQVESWTWMRTEWWGILGLIGWAYLVVALIYFLLFVGSAPSSKVMVAEAQPDPSDDQALSQQSNHPVRREWLMAALGLLMLMFLVSQHGGFFTRLDDKAWLGSLRPVVDAIQSAVEFVNRYVDLGTQLGSLPAIMMAGCLLGTILVAGSEISSPRDRIRWALMFAFVLLISGLMMDTFAGINKIAATPTWCFWSAALATLIWIILFVVMDVQHWKSWAVIIQPAGANPLIAYLLHPIILFSLSLTGLGEAVRAYSSSASPWIVVAGSLAMAMAICGLTGLIAKFGFRIRV